MAAYPSSIAGRGCGCGNPPDTEDDPTPTPPVDTVETPVISPESQAFDDSLEISISTDTEGANIYYTLDGSNPTSGSTQYAVPFSVTETTTVKAIATREGWTDSGIASETYTEVDEVLQMWFMSATEILTEADLEAALLLPSTGNNDISTFAGFRPFIFESGKYQFFWVADGVEAPAAFPAGMEFSTGSTVGLANALDGYASEINGWNYLALSFRGTSGKLYRTAVFPDPSEYIWLLTPA